MNLHVFLYVLSVQEVFQFQLSSVYPTIRRTMVEIDLRLCGRQESASDGNCLGCGQVVSQVVLPGFRHLAGDNEVCLLKILEVDVDDRIVQDFRVGSFDRVAGLRHSHPQDADASGALEGDIAVRLHRNRLVELRRQGKVKIQNVAAIYSIARIPLRKLRAVIVRSKRGCWDAG